MKKRTAFICAILSLIPIGQPLFIKTGIFLSSSAVIFSFSKKVNAQTTNFYINRGNDKAEVSDHYGAISDFTKAIEINPKSYLAYYNRANSKDELKDYYGAIADYTKAIEINPNDTDLYVNRSIAKEYIGDINGACIDAKKAVSLGDTATDNKNWIRDNC